MTTITIYLKSIDESTGQHKDIAIKVLKEGKGMKYYKYLVKQWKRYKAVSLPTYALTINSDEIYTIMLEHK